MVFTYENVEGFHLGSNEHFFMLTKATFTSDVIFHQQSEEKAPNLGEKELMQFLLPLYRAYLKNPAKLYMKVGSSLGRHSVHALEKIEKGRVIIEYVGEINPANKRSSTYRWGPIDALVYRNLSGLVEDGFPNIAAFHLYNVNGIPIRIIFVALEEIPANAMIAINYGMNHSVKLSHHTEYRLDAMRRFFLKNRLGKVILRIKELRSRSPKDLGWKLSLELENLVAKVRYLYHTPGAMLQLLDVIDKEEVFYWFDQADFRYFFIDIPTAPNARQMEIISHLNLIRNASSGQYSDLLESIRHRIFFRAYLAPIANGDDEATSREEAMLWNRAFDAIEEENCNILISIFAVSKKNRELLDYSISFAREINSPLLPWLQTLIDPLSPLHLAG